MEKFGIDNFVLDSGQVLPEARVADQVTGELNPEMDNLVLLSTAFGSTISDHKWMVGVDSILNPERYCVITVALLGNGESTSPSTIQSDNSLGTFPMVSFLDNVRLQSLLIDHAFGGASIALVAGWSMGAQLALQWAAAHPNRVRRVAAICGTAVTSVHNRVFLEGVKSILTLDESRDGGRAENTLRALGRFYAGWAVSHEFYRSELYLALGYASLEEYLVRDWEENFVRRDRWNLLAMANTWQAADIGNTPGYGGSAAQALRGIRAQTLMMPCLSDLYFRAEDAEAEAKQIPTSRFRPIASPLGHRAGNPKSSQHERAFIQREIAELLAEK